MTRAKPSSKSFRDFSKLLFAARQKKGWTQVELARQAHVALRTIVNVESDPATRKVRFDVIIRLAVALEQSPRLWLQTAGHCPREVSRKSARTLEKLDFGGKSGRKMGFGQQF